MITPREKGTFAVRLLDGRVLVTGGAGRRTSSELYDPATGTWLATGSSIHPHFNHGEATLLLDGRVLVDDELYDPATGSWTANGKPAGVGGPATLLTDGRVLRSGSPSALYDPATGTWSTTGKMITRRLDIPAPVRLLDGRVLVAGGSDPSDHEITSAEVYDPATGTWSATTSMLGSARGLTLLSDGKVLAYEQLYDPATGTWTPFNHDTGGYLPVVLNDGKVLFPGSSHLYDPVTGSWAETARMLPDSYGNIPPIYSATLLLDGTVLVNSGSDGAQLYIPAGIAPPPGLAPVPSPAPTPVPTPTPTATP